MLDIVDKKMSSFRYHFFSNSSSVSLKNSDLNRTQKTKNWHKKFHAQFPNL